MDVFKTLRSKLLNRLLRQGTDYHDAEDAIQLAFERMHRVQQVKAVRNPYALVSNLLGKIRIDVLRSNQRYQSGLVDEPLDALELIDLAPNPEECAQAAQRIDRVSERMKQLSARTQKIFYLHYIDGMSYAQIAAVFQVSVSAIEKHIARAALLIDEALGEE